MLIKAHVITHNEEQRLPWYLDHYEKIADQIIVWDNYSTDATQDIARAHPKVELQLFGTPGVLSNKAFLDVKNNCWKPETSGICDWAIVGDVDELLYHPDLHKLLEETDATLLGPGRAYTLVCDHSPNDYRAVNTGFRDSSYKKLCVINSHAIIDMRYNPGCHSAHPMGKVKIQQLPELIMYHYKYMGVEETLARYALRRERRSEQDKFMGWGVHYEFSPDEVKAKFALAGRLPSLNDLDARKPEETVTITKAEYDKLKANQ